MRTTTRGVVAASAALVIAALFAAAIFSGHEASAGVGGYELVAVDTDTTGNAPAAPGSIESCRATTIGSTFDIDVIVEGISAGDGISGIGGNVVYDPAIIKITARDTAGTSLMMNQTLPKGSYFDALSDAVPDTDGDYRHDAAEIGGTAESGNGVVMRLTIEAIGNGTSPLDLTDNIEFDGTPNVLNFMGAPMTVDSVQDGSIVVGGTCGGPTNTPTVVPSGPTATPTVVPTGPTDTPTVVPTGPTDTPTVVPTGPTDTPTVVPTGPTDTPTPTPTGGGQTELMGDTDCDGQVTARDNQALLRFILQQNPLSQTEPCPDPGTAPAGSASIAGAGAPPALWGDWDCDGGVSARDNQALLRFILQQNPLSQTEPCTDIGQPVQF